MLLTLLIEAQLGCLLVGCATQSCTQALVYRLRFFAGCSQGVIRQGARCKEKATANSEREADEEAAIREGKRADIGRSRICC